MARACFLPHGVRGFNEDADGNVHVIGNNGEDIMRKDATMTIDQAFDAAEDELEECARVDALFRRSMVRSAECLRNAIHLIDAEFGHGYAKDHPELILGYVRAALHTAWEAKSENLSTNELAQVLCMIKVVHDEIKTIMLRADR